MTVDDLILRLQDAQAAGRGSWDIRIPYEDSDGDRELDSLREIQRVEEEECFLVGSSGLEYFLGRWREQQFRNSPEQIQLAEEARLRRVRDMTPLDREIYEKLRESSRQMSISLYGDGKNEGEAE